MTPTELRYDRARRVLVIVFGEDECYELSAEFLRVHSPSAEVRGHGGPMKLVTGKEGVGIRAIEPVGNYAVRLVFDDGHDSGLYSWKVLQELGRDHERLWREYRERLQSQVP